MSIPIGSFKTLRPTQPERLGLHVALTVSRGMSRMKPSVLHNVLGKYAGVVDKMGDRSVDAPRAERAHAALCHLSPRCASHEACFVRSLALFLYLRPLGRNISWHAGFRTDPFLGHAWIQVDSHPISEALEVSQFIETMRVH
ncbi:lasso peptide biosynthesis B2 protein [Pseudarthrobacter sp. NPDC058329]|uniref:lasso peptide biosynthesis B2 protein n=1 Tax=Pseudarthrobacter sp. NPDC058329 TaxID=3346448 RepID=UPI0036DB1F96